MLSVQDAIDYLGPKGEGVALRAGEDALTSIVRRWARSQPVRYVHSVHLAEDLVASARIPTSITQCDMILSLNC